MIRIQDRDQELLKKLSDFGVLSSSQVAQRFFHGVALTTALRRLRVLERCGYLICSGHLKTGEKVWSLSKSGAMAIGAPLPSRFTNKNTLLHDVSLSEVRFTLESMGLGEGFTSETEMKKNINHYYTDGDVIPDGLFVATFGSELQVISLELEMSPKSHKRYRSLFKDYGYKSAIGLIWYIVKEASIIKPILKQWQEVSQSSHFKPTQKIIFCLLDDFISRKSDAIIVDENLDKKPLRELFMLQTSGQGLSREGDGSLSRSESSDLKQKQELSSAPEGKDGCSFALDPSPPTLWEGVEGLEHLKTFGSGEDNKIGGEI